jgi:phosphohistidine phosphatase
MYIYLLRHAIAVERGTVHYPNDDRPLSEKGTKRFLRGAQGIAALLNELDVILTSPLKRAHETAIMTAKQCGIPHKVVMTEYLLPGCIHNTIFPLLRKYKDKKHVMLVGHEPDLSRLASNFLGSSRSAINFKKGALCCIELPSLTPRAAGVLQWHLQPKQLRNLKRSRNY